LGPNGAGKSTTFNILSLGMKRTKGKIRFFNENIDAFSSI
jgi:ABC-type multidrug transport system ATPase subunit